MSGWRDVNDPSDWLKTPAPQLYTVESNLRCQICKDFYRDPMITSCSHTFCSICIHRCITSDGQCPLCRKPEERGKLRRNGVLGDLVEAFIRARRELEDMVAQQPTYQEKQARSKRKLDNIEESRDPQSTRMTRSRSRKSLSPPPSQPPNMAKEVIKPSTLAQGHRSDKLVACPICQQRMEEYEVFAHLEIHETGNGKECHTSGQSLGKRSSLIRRPKPSPPKIPDRLPSINYNLLNEQKLRKKLNELGIPSLGSKSTLIRRHTEWVNMVNANCDSLDPRPKADLLLELAEWEKTLSSSAPASMERRSGVIMDKDFDRAVWSSLHATDFQRLAAEARARPKVNHGESVGNISAQIVEVQGRPSNSSEKEILDKSSNSAKDVFVLEP